MEGWDLARDRISGLPDPLLTHILSFIPTEEAVRTCILSKRWIKVWASLPVLVFDDHTTQYDDLTDEEYQQREAKFLRFFRGVMNLLLADIPNCPTLKNLKSLELGDLDSDYDWNLVVCLLQHSSNLKDLILHFNRPSEDATEEEFEGDNAFRHKYLEVVKISCPGKNVKLVE